MRVAFLVPSLANKGPVIVVRNIVEYLSSIGIYCEVFYFSDIVELEFPCKTRRIIFFDFLRVKGFDIIHSHGLRPDMFSFLNPFVGGKRVSTIHNYMADDLRLGAGYSRFKSIFFERVWSFLHVRMFRVVVLSKHAVDYYSKLINKNKISYIYNGVSIPETHSISSNEYEFLGKISTQYKVMGTISVLTKRKGLSQVIRSLKYFENVFFVVVGDGPDSGNLVDLAHRLGVQDRCLFLGYKSNALDYMKYFDYFIFPSYSEGFGLSLIEAAAFKKPSVVSNIEIFRELFDDSQVSFADLDNVESMNLAIKSVIENGDVLSLNMHDRYLKSYTLECMGSSYYKLYVSMLAS